jgi:hypothetical protein
MILNLVILIKVPKFFEEENTVLQCYRHKLAPTIKYIKKEYIYIKFTQHIQLNGVYISKYPIAWT